MARRGNGNNANYLNFTGTPAVTAVPLTISAWFNVVDNTNYYAVVSILSFFAGSDDYFTMGANAGRVYVETASGGTYAGVDSGGSRYQANTWVHGCCVFRAANSRSAYLNGGAPGTNTTSVTPTGLDRTQVGTFVKNAGTFNPINGSVAEVGIWNVALNQKEIWDLARGTKPTSVRKGALRGYYPQVGTQSPEFDWTGANRSLTINGTMAVSGQPKMLNPQVRGVGYVPAAFSGDEGGLIYRVLSKW